MDAVDPDPPAAAHPAAQAFVRVFNLRHAALAFYLALAVALSYRLGTIDHERYVDVAAWAADTVRYTRQNLLTALSLLLACAVAEATLAAWPVRHRLAAHGRRSLAVGAGALLGTVLRHGVANAGDPQAVWSLTWLLSTVTLWSLIGGVAYAALMAAHEQTRARQALAQAARASERLRAQQLQAQWLALNAQIEPHFLFNTLATVKRLCETTPPQGRDLLRALIAYLQTALPSLRRELGTLGEELALVRHYLHILQLRMGPRLRFEIDCPPELHRAVLPPAVLGTLVENAIKHGLQPQPAGGCIRIRAERHGATLALSVTDDGRGLVAGGAGGGLGLSNTRARLAACFGPQARLDLAAAQPRGVVAQVQVPLREAAP